jgi:hypothetical protein
MILIWRGWGILVAPIVLVSFFAALLLVEKYPGEIYRLTGYLLSHESLVPIFGGAFSAALNFALIYALKAKYGEAAQARGDALFFIPVRIWAYLSVAVAVLGVIYGLLWLF